jgi:hypothetical protein
LEAALVDITNPRHLISCGAVEEEYYSPVYLLACTPREQRAALNVLKFPSNEILELTNGVTGRMVSDH